MAKLHISEFSSLGQSFEAGYAPIPRMPPIAEQDLDIGAEIQSNAFNAATKYIRVKALDDCHITTGPDPEATTSMFPMLAGDEVYLGVGKGDKLSVIAAA